MSGVRDVAAAKSFQSAPADCRRENHERHGRPGVRHCFNPLPPTVGGRIETGRWMQRCGFNPLPPTVGGRMAVVQT